MQEWQEKIEQEVGQLKEEVKQLREEREQQTEEIKITVDRPSKEVVKRLDQLEKDLDTRSELWLDTLQGNYDDHRADSLQLKESQADFKDKLIEHGSKLDRIEGNLNRIVTFLEKQGME
jgi:chromosome segregation ATPase